LQIKVQVSIFTIFGLFCKEAGTAPLTREKQKEGKLRMNADKEGIIKKP
jgi:hypothetical protein